jgi:tRNA A-37 threonylcarbamoyl transferase component Bud32/tetratricopeptide (TPR) repeat protein
MACPDADELQSFLARRLDAGAVERVAAHVERCETCRALVLELGRAGRAASLADERAPLEERHTAPLDGVASTQLDGTGPRTSPAVGASIGRYVLSRVLGVGGMGVVYAAWDPQLERQVALKLLRPDARIASDVQQARLVREAQAMARLSHPNVITVYEVGSHGDQLFVAMELVDGGTLGQWLREKPRSWREIVRAFAAAGEGLGAAHSAGLVHRDFKPDNVLLRRDGRLLVTDFGLARSSGDGEPWVDDAAELRAGFDHRLTRTGAVVGTPAYMAPEQLSSNRCDARSDLFSFCVALHEALYGTRPFQGRTVAELRESLAREAPEPRGAAVPAWVTRTVMRGLRLDPAARPQTMRELTEALANDPRHKLRRAGAFTLLALMAVALAALVGDRVRETRHRCDAVAAPMAEHWNDARKTAVAHAFAQSGLPYAADTAGYVARALDGWATVWRDERVAACQAHQQGAQSSELYDRRMQCLDDRLGELDALVTELSRGDNKAVDHAQDLLQTADSPLRCRDEKRLRSVEPPPALARQLAPTRERLTRVMALCESDRFDEARGQLATLKDEVAWPPLEAVRLTAQAMVAMDAGDLGQAERGYYAAIAAAERGSDDWQATRDYVVLAHVVGDLEGHHEEALRIIELGKAKDARTGYDPFLPTLLGYEAEMLRFIGRAKEGVPLMEQEIALERKRHLDRVQVAKTLASYGNVLSMSGRLDDGLRAHREALDIMEQSFGPAHPLTCVSLVNVGVDEWYRGHPELALPLFDRALAARQKLFKPGHPLIASVLVNRAGAYVALQRWLEALADATPAIDILAAAIGAQTPALIEPLGYAGRAQIGLGRPKLALPPAERALAIANQGDADPADVAAAKYVLARALVESGGDRRRAAALADAAQAALAKLARETGAQYVARLAEVDAWRRAVPGSK